jgi:hypothetical protein
VRRVPAIVMLCVVVACSRAQPVASSSSHRAVRQTVASGAAGLAAGEVQDNAVLHPQTVGGDVQAPVAIERVQPAMPKYLSVAGPLLLEAVIDKHGIVRNVRVLRDGTKPSVGPAYVAALKKWRFGQPLSRDNQSTSSTTCLSSSTSDRPPLNSALHRTWPRNPGIGSVGSRRWGWISGRLRPRMPSTGNQ